MATAHMTADISSPESFVGVISVAAQKVHLSAAGTSAISKVEASLNDLSLGTGAGLMAAANRPAVVARSQAVINRVSGSDDSLKADSSSELGTKPPSLDGKSITSGTTFALDEKESLRPDDSASVQAAAEEDDSSIRDSLIAGSRMGSDLAFRARGIQLGDLPERRLVQQMSGERGVHTPQSTTSEQPAGVTPQIPLRSTGSSDALNVIYRQAPDDKLLEALAAPRDRLFLLRLEKDVIDFVQNSKEPYMDLPPSNSFCRMLTHKLADYYHMTHSYEAHIGSVRIFRTPFCRVPSSLATMIPQPVASTNSTPPPVVLPRKIMRRGQDDEGGLISAGASKTTSETGSDAKDKQPAANQKLSREEREEMYKLARQRIFGNSEDTTSEVDGDYGMSRTNSATNKSANGKKGKTPNKRRDDTDNFESRRQYTSYWGAQQQAWMSQPPTQYMPATAGQFNGQPAPAFPPQMGHVYAQQQPAGYPSMPGALPSASSYSPFPQQQQYQPGGSPMTAFGSPALPAAPPQPQGWQPGFGQPGYGQQGYLGHGPSPAGPSPVQGNAPYPFGQLPVNVNPNDPKSQHPIPGSYNRNHAFNPKTQSFVPGGIGSTNAAPQTLQPPFTAPGSHHSSPQIGAPHLAYAGHGGAMPPPPYGGGYSMARQGSNSSMAACFTPPHITPPHIQHAPPPPPMASMASMASMQHGMPPQAHHPNRSSVPLGANQLFNSHLITYGNPASLPQKPATGL